MGDHLWEEKGLKFGFLRQNDGFLVRNAFIDSN